MNALRDRERDTPDYREPRSDYREQRPAYREATSDREISLGTGTILGIFFALSLLCAVFFGFGYSMGRKSSVQPVSASTQASASGGLFSSFKPSAGNPLGSVYQQRKNAARGVVDPQPTSPRQDDGPSASSPTMPGAPATPQQSSPGTSKLETDPVPVVVKPQPRSSGTSTPSATSSPAVSSVMPATTPNGTAMVQVAAVSHEEDADLLLSALKKRGYEVFIRHEAQDRLLHIQVGPFASKKDADVMRQRLLSDGYNAIVK